MRHRPKRSLRLRVLALALIGGVTVVATSAPAQPEPLAICKGQRYALCAAGSCLVYNQVA